MVVDLDTMEPTNQLSPVAVDFCRGLGSTARTVQDVLDGPDDKVSDPSVSSLPSYNA